MCKRTARKDVAQTEVLKRSHEYHGVETVPKLAPASEDAEDRVIYRTYLAGDVLEAFKHLANMHFLLHSG